jgi:hypothetical protein
MLGLSLGSMALEGGFIERLGEGAIDAITAFIAEAPSCYWITAEHYLHGSICRPASDYTAFGLRRSGYSSRIFSAWRESAEAESSTDWARRLSAALAGC